MDSMENVILVGPALRSLKKAFPEARITLLASPVGAQAGTLLPWVDAILAWHSVWQTRDDAEPVDATREMELINLLKAGDYDAAFIFTNSDQSPLAFAYAASIAGIPIRVGQSKELSGSVLTHPVKPGPDNKYQAYRNLDLLEAIGLPRSGLQLELQVSERDQQEAYGLLNGANIQPQGAYMIMAPEAGVSSRQYDFGRFAAVARKLVSRANLPLVVLGDHSNGFDSDPIRQAVYDDDRIHSLRGQASTPVQAALIQNASLVLTTNSPAMHIAEAYLRPMVVLYAGTDLLEQWAPRRSPARLMMRTTACSPCHYHTCPLQKECLEILPDEVVNESLHLLNHSKEYAEPQLRLFMPTRRMLSVF